MRRRLILATVALALFSCVAGAIAAATGTDKPKADVFVAATGSDQRDCRSKQQACATLNRAYVAARPGEVVEVAGGHYPAQEIVVDPAKTSRRHVLIRPARGARVTLAGLTLGSGDQGDGPRHLTIEGLRMSYAGADRQLPATALPGTADVVWRDIDAGNFTLWGVKHFRVEGGDWGPCATGPDAPCSNSKIDAGPVGFDTDGVIVEDARFHDYRFSPTCFQDGQDCHYECMYVNGSANVTIRRSTLRDCALFDIFVTLSGPDAARVGHRNLKIVGNVLDTPVGREPGRPATGTLERDLARLVPELAARLPQRRHRLQLVPEQHRPPARPDRGLPDGQRPRRRQPARLGRLRRALQLRPQRLEQRPAPRPLRER